MSLFDTLWSRYPYNTSILKKRCFNDQPGTENDKPFSDYCAIMLSECLIKSEVDISTLPGKRCWSHGGTKHFLLAEQLANALAADPPAGFGGKEDIAPADYESTLDGRTGVIFFGDYWQRAGQSFENRSGDHIDLWNDNRTTGRGRWSQDLREFFGLASDRNSAKKIWFWEVK